jgi:hypothetical protein
VVLTSTALYCVRPLLVELTPRGSVRGGVGKAEAGQARIRHHAAVAVVRRVGQRVGELDNWRATQSWKWK